MTKKIRLLMIASSISVVSLPLVAASCGLKKPEAETNNKPETNKNPGENNQTQSDEETKEDKLASKFLNIFETNVKVTDKQLFDDLVAKKATLFYDYKQKTVVAVKDEQKIKWNNPDTYTKLLDIKEEFKKELGEHKPRLVNLNKPTFEKSDRKNKNNKFINLSSKLDYKIQKIDKEGSKQEYILTLEYKVATWDKKGQHKISTKTNKSMVTIKLETKEETQNNNNPRTNDEILNNLIKEIKSKMAALSSQKEKINNYKPKSESDKKEFNEIKDVLLSYIESGIGNLTKDTDSWTFDEEFLSKDELEQLLDQLKELEQLANKLQTLSEKK